MTQRSFGSSMLGRSRPVSALAVLSFILALAALLTAVLAGLGTRWGWWDFRAGFLMLRIAAIGGAATAALSLIGFIRARPGGPHRGAGWAITGFVLGLIVFAIPWSYYQRRTDVPPIHDITTDSETPPEFVAAQRLRPDDANPTRYGGPEIANLQRQAYPDIQPLIVQAPLKDVFEQAITAVHAMGWQVVAVDPMQGRIEAVDETLWFGFKDDVVVRVQPVAEGTRVDIRSASRVGKSDLGTNAARIRGYMAKLRELAG